MALSFLFQFFSMVLPVVTLVFGSARLRPRAFFFVPIGITLQVGFFGIFAMLSYPFLGYGWTKYLVLMSSSTFCVYLVLNRMSRADLVRSRRFQSAKLLALVAILAFVSILDNAFILDRNGWSFEGGSVTGSHATYFRAPLNGDMERNTVVINALLRKSGPPFLIGTKFVYQIFWHHMNAVFVSFFDGAITNYPYVKGLALFNSYLLFLMVFWLLCLIRPRLFLRLGVGSCILFLIVTHADLFGFALSMLGRHQPGIEADWSCPPWLFRNFSLKLIGLTAPQHALALSFFALYLSFPYFIRKRAGRAAMFLEGLVFCIALLISAILSAFFFTLYFAYGFFTHAKSQREAWGYCGKGLGCLAIGIIVHRIAYGFTPLALFSRPGIDDITYFITERMAMMAVPLILVGVAGAAGFLLTVLMVTTISEKKERRLLAAYPIVLVFGALFFNYFVTGREIRRHFSLIAALMVALVLAQLLPAARRLAGTRLGRQAIGIVMVLSLLLHGYFLYSYTGKPSWLDPAFAWKDYFEINSIVKKTFPGMSIIAAADPRGIGLQFPVIAEVATSLTFVSDAAVHSTLTPEQLDVFRKINISGDVAPYARRAGYQAIVWGPLEDNVWGPRTKSRFVSKDQLLASFGTVSLYRLVDGIDDGFVSQKIRDGDFYYRWGKMLEEKGWPWEALEKYAAASRKSPEEPLYHEALGQTLSRLGLIKPAFGEFERAMAEGGQSPELDYGLGTVLYKSGKVEDAISKYQNAIKRNPRLVPAYNNLAVALMDRGLPSEAERILRKAESIPGKNYEITLNLGKALAAQGKVSEAESFLKKALADSVDPHQKVDSYLALGDFTLAMKDVPLASVYYDKAISLNPRSAPTHVKKGYAYSILGMRHSAISQFNRALQLDPSYSLARQALAVYGGTAYP